MHSPEQPSSSLSPPETEPIADRLYAEWHAATTRVRVLLVIYLSIGAWGGIYGGVAISREYPTVWGLGVSFLVLEPIGLACGLALISIAAPRSALAELLCGALSRARFAIWLVLAGYLFTEAA
jgi:hypothetical protein